MGNQVYLFPPSQPQHHNQSKITITSSLPSLLSHQAMCACSCSKVELTDTGKRWGIIAL